MKNAFLKELDDYIEAHEPTYVGPDQDVEIGVSLSYESMQALGLTKGFNARLPIGQIAMIDKFLEFTPCSSKGELISKMLESVLDEFLDSRNENIKEEFYKVAGEALDKGMELRGDKPFPHSVVLEALKAGQVTVSNQFEMELEK